MYEGGQYTGRRHAEPHERSRSDATPCSSSPATTMELIAERRAEPAGRPDLGVGHAESRSRRHAAVDRRRDHERGAAAARRRRRDDPHRDRHDRASSSAAHPDQTPAPRRRPGDPRRRPASRSSSAGSRRSSTCAAPPPRTTSCTARRCTTGDELLLMYSSANRDERVFDDPERFDVDPAHNHHVAFGFGTHFCLGASLARLEIRVMFEELLRGSRRCASRRAPTRRRSRRLRLRLRSRSA